MRDERPCKCPEFAVQGKAKYRLVNHTYACLVGSRGNQTLADIYGRHLSPKPNDARN